MKKLNWGIIGSGGITHALVKGLAESETGQLAAVGSRSQESSDTWGDKYNLPKNKRYPSYAALLADKEIDAVYIALLNDRHCELVVQAAEAGKHILCEKPLALNHAEVTVMLEACRANKVFFMEAFMWRCHPGTASWLKALREGLIGEVRVIEAQFGFNLGGNQTHTRMINKFGGGGIMDVGCYCLSAARAIAGAARGKDFEEPTDLFGVGHVGATGVDEWATATLKFPGNVVANLSTGVQIGLHNQLRVYGSNGNMVIPSPWFADGRTIVHVNSEKGPREVNYPSEKPLYTHEVDMLGRCVAAGRVEAEPPGMTWADSLGQQAAVDRWRKALGVVFEDEKPENLKLTLARRPLQRRKGANIPQGKIAGLDKPVSRVIMGCNALNFADMPSTCALLDDYFERGGNAADTAWIYGPNNERAIGKWISLRGVRDQFVLIAKGAHTATTNRPFHDPGCDPATLLRQFHESLDRLGLDYVDIYCMHRDNLSIPVGEFVDVLSDLSRAGYIRVFGGSNWTIERLEAANAYAQKHGKQGFGVVSNNLSLATWNEPMWPHCVSSSDKESRAWLQKAQLPLLAWSSQASGFFTGLIPPNDTSTPWASEVTRVWGNPDNYRRLARAQELAKKKGCTALQIALAYVLCQPLNVFAMIGPRLIEETRTSLEALEVKLTPDELAWLNLER